MPRFRVNDTFELSWDEVKLLRELCENLYNCRDITKLMKAITERNLQIIIQLYKYAIKENMNFEDLKTFIEKI